LALAAGDGWPDGRLLALFAVGALVMRAAGCVVNDLADREIDARVARTRERPLASGAITVMGALVFLGLLLAAGLAVLTRLDGAAIVLGVASLALVAVYPFMKRITWWPQAFLGLTFNWGALMGWAAARGGLDWPALALYAAGIAWTLAYDTIYAHQDKADDVVVGVKSSALRLGARTRPWLVGFHAAMVALLALAGALVGLGWPFYPGLAVAAAHLGWQAATVNIDDPADCLAKFKANAWTGAIVFAAIVAGARFG